MLVPVILESIILPANAWLWMTMGWAGCHFVNFDANQLPVMISAFFMSGGNWGNVILTIVNLALAAIICSRSSRPTTSISARSRLRKRPSSRLRKPPE